MWRMPRFPILDRSREWKGDVMPTNATVTLQPIASTLRVDGSLSLFIAIALELPAVSEAPVREHLN